MTISEWYLKMKDGVSATMNKIGVGADSASSKFTILQRNSVRTQERLSAVNGTGGSLITTFKGIAAAAGLTMGIAALKNVGEELLNTATKAEGYRRALDLIEGDNQKSAATFQWLKDTANQYGASFDSISEGYKKIASSTRGTQLAGQATRELLEGVTMASVSLGMSGEESLGALLAMSQMISKGKVSMEELSGQLGERLPGALQIASRAMGLTTQQLIAQVSKGNLDPNLFIPKLAAGLKTEFSASADEASHSLMAIQNRMKNSFLFFKQEVAAKLAPHFAAAFEKITVYFEANKNKIIEKITGVVDALIRVGSAIGSVASFLYNHSGAITTLLAAYTAFKLQLFVTNGLIRLNSWYTGLSTGAIIINTLMTEGWAAAQVALNIALTANPIGVIVMAIAALGVGIYMAYQKCEVFRSVVLGLWETWKAFAAFWWSLFKKLPLVQAIIKIVENFDKIKAAVHRVWDTLKPFFTWIKDAAMKFIQPVIDMIKKLADGFKWVADKLGITEKATSVVNTFKAGYAKGKREDDIPETPLAKAGLDKILNPTVDPSKNDPKLDQGINSVSGGGKQVRNVTVTIGALVKEMNIHAASTKESALDIKRMIEEALLRAIQGAELASANG